MRLARRALLVVLLFALGCNEQTPPTGPTKPQNTVKKKPIDPGLRTIKTGDPRKPSYRSDDKKIVSMDILARTPVKGLTVHVRHVLIAWRDLARMYRGRLPLAAKKRTKEQADQLVKEIAERAKKGEDFVALMKKYSEDPGSASIGRSYEVTAMSRLVPPFKRLSLRMKMGEVGVVRTRFGWHVVKRVAPDPPDPLQSNEILKRKPETDKAYVRHIHLAWDDLRPMLGRYMDPRAMKRTKEATDKLVKEISEKLKKGEKFLDLMKKHSEDKRSLSREEPLTISKTTRWLPVYKDLALRLKENEVGQVKTWRGWFVIKRFPPPPPDPLESSEILKRKPAGDGDVLVDIIFVSWDKKVPRFAPRIRKEAKTRKKEEADAIVKKALARLKKGEDFAKVRKELSDDLRMANATQPTRVNNSPFQLPAYRTLGTRLKVGEYGVIKGRFGFYLIKRVPPPPPDPLESKEILDRKQTAEKVKVKHILVAWKGLGGPMRRLDKRAKDRTKAEADKMVQDLMAKLKKGAKIDALMKEYSEDPGSAKSGRAYDVTPKARLVPPFKKLSLRLKKNEVGLVKTQFGWHVIQRIE
ncbi:MAG: peptidylprolyl isomerase [Myxococcales bacterium]|nr:peptidylprolyl isomerase [Myxococcales bacterium]